MVLYRYWLEMTEIERKCSEIECDWIAEERGRVEEQTSRMQFILRDKRAQRSRCSEKQGEKKENPSI